MTTNFVVILPTSIVNRRTIRVHGNLAREISLLSGNSIPFRFPTSSMQSLQTHMEDSQKKAGSSSLAFSCRTFRGSFFARPDFEKSYTALPWSFPPSFELPLPASDASLCDPAQKSELARAVDPGLRRTVLSISRALLGSVFDGRKAVPAESSGLPRSCASAGPRKRAVLVSGIHDDSRPDIPPHLCLGLRRHSGDHRAGNAARLDRAAVSFSSHQPVARQPRKTKTQTRRQTRARDPLPAYSPSPGAAGRSTPGIGPQAVEGARAKTNGLSRYAHGSPGVSEKDR
jgi:hypothetical protein